MPPLSRPTLRLIGLGNIGFRHLQGLAPLAGEIRLEGLDHSQDAVLRAQTEWNSYAGAEGVFGPDLDESGPAQLTVIATSAAGREALVREQLDRGVRRFLLEKIVFTQNQAFERTQAALDDVGACAFVNTPRRLWPLYRALTDQARAAGGSVELSVSGRLLGFACNSVHYIDLLQMLAGQDEVEALDAEVSAPWESKRPGYYEVWGAARFRTPNGSLLSLSATPADPLAATITLTIAGRRLSIDEITGQVTDETGAVVQEFGRSPYQSELSVLYTRPLMQGLAPQLPTLAQSAVAHRAYLEILTPAFTAAGLASDAGLPVT